MAGTTLLSKRAQDQFAAVVRSVREVDPTTLAGCSVGRWLADRDVSPEADSVVRALLRLVTYSGEIDELSADAAFAQLQTAGAGVVYVDGGWRQLTDALRARVPVHTHAPVRTVEADGHRVAVLTDDTTYRAKSVIVAAGTPAAARAVLTADPGWGDLGEPVTAACLDVGARRVPSPGYLLGIDEPLYGATQSPPARQTPDGSAVVGAVRYGARGADEDRAQLEAHLRAVGVADDDVVVRRFLAHMVVAGALPRAATGGLEGRPDVTASGSPGVFIAGDWVGPEGLLADAALASGQRAALAARDVVERSAIAG